MPQTDQAYTSSIEKKVVFWEEGHAILYDTFSNAEIKVLLEKWEIDSVGADGTLHLIIKEADDGNGEETITKEGNTDGAEGKGN